ncbi:hypothetical protein BIV57_13505 [Mangrovactinospora gilvigrisea]|uniref:Uncharacterized protein n=1 Tax=Mangrovactinospora gilvigrisea TaxID=1428644 RepID=A0A1J7BE82_9ACTN|nr:hypothetical protein [Mangrovactinospora gilvigrisea]OIV36999.1 hypothetical protein BIV57_13505 [Mangrovactinospora gilvigrisea]
MSDGIDDEGWPCIPSKQVQQILTDPSVPPQLFSEVIALTVRINELRGELPEATADPEWPAMRRVGIGKDGALGVAEYVIMADADEPHVVLTRIQLI